MVKNLAANAGDMGSIPGSGRAPVEGNGNPQQCSCLRNLIDRRDWQALVAKSRHGVAKSQTVLAPEHQQPVILMHSNIVTHVASLFLL